MIPSDYFLIYFAGLVPSVWFWLGYSIDHDITGKEMAAFIIFWPIIVPIKLTKFFIWAIRNEFSNK